MVGINRIFLLAASFLFLSGFYSCPSQDTLSVPAVLNEKNRLVDLVDPTIGSGGFPWARGNVSPAAAVPFGRIRLGADTTLMGKRTSPSGYGGNDSHVLGFSHTRLSGTGAWEGGLLRTIPFHEWFESSLGVSKINLAFEKSSEVSSPGYYSLYLPNPRVQAQFVATERGALHEYTYFDPNRDRILYFHLNSSLRPSDVAGSVSVQKVSFSIDAALKTIRVSGRLFDSFSARYDGLPFYFTLVFSDSWEDSVVLSNLDPITANSYDFSKGELLDTDDAGQIYLGLKFPRSAAASKLSIRLGLSYVSAAGADLAFNTEVSGQTLDALLQQARDKWEDLLDRIQVTGGTEDQRKIFYTGLYHSFLMPTMMDDGPSSAYAYPAFDKTTKTLSHPFYSDLSIWDTFRTVHPLYNLILWDKNPEILSSILLMADQDGYLPRWASGAGNANSMFGFPGVMVLAESALKEVPGWDAAKGYEWSKKVLTPGATPEQGCLADFVSLGHCPDSVSFGLEYAYAFKSLALYAALQNDSTVAAESETKSKYFTNYWSSKRGFFVPKDRNGVLDEGISESDSSYLSFTRSGKFYVEGTAWHWAFSPFIMGEEIFALDPTRFHKRLERFLSRGTKSLGAPWPVHGYWHGNEHDFHAPYLFAMNGRADLTQKWVRRLMDTKYRASRMGLDGDDDGGALSAWYNWSALGIFPIAGSDDYLVGTPLFDTVTIKTSPSDVLTISSNISQFSGSPYLESVNVNGAALSAPRFKHQELVGPNKTIEFFHRTTSKQVWARQ